MSKPERAVAANTRVNIRGQHRASHRLSQKRAKRAAAILRSMRACVSSAMLERIVAHIGKIVPREIHHFFMRAIIYLTNL